MIPLKEVLALAAARLNTLPVAVLRANGITASGQRTLVEDGVLERISNGVYRFTGGAADETALCAAACCSALNGSKPETRYA